MVLWRNQPAATWKDLPTDRSRVPPLFPISSTKSQLEGQTRTLSIRRVEKFCKSNWICQHPVMNRQVTSVDTTNAGTGKDIHITTIPDTSLGNLSLKGQYQDGEFLLPEYSQEIYAYLKGLEVRLRPRVNYIVMQPDITSPMRRILVDWLVEVCQVYKLNQETLYLAVSYVDRFLSGMAVHRVDLQLVGIACMIIAAKYENRCPPDVSNFVYNSDDAYNKQQLLRMERLVLQVLAFELSVPTANCFLLRFCSLCKVPAPTVCLARYLCELTLLETEPFLKYLPSETACAALALANHTMGKEMWPSEMQLVTEYTEEDFRECLESLYMLYLVSAYYPQQPIQEKYRLPKYYCVSCITPPPSLPVFYIDVENGYTEGNHRQFDL